MLGTQLMAAVKLFFAVCLFHAAWARPHADDEEGLEDRDGERYKRNTDVSYGWKHTSFLIDSLRQRLRNNDLNFCMNDPFKGVGCPEESNCVDWHEICDGHQTCGLEVREACINSTIDSYGRTDDRFCVGDEDDKWCAYKQLAPKRCGEDFVFDLSKKRRQYRIRHPGFPSQYLNDRFCFWTISTAPGHFLYVEFKKFNTEENFDYVSVGQGLRRDDQASTLIYKFNGKQQSFMFQTNRNMPNPHQVWVTFKSDDWDTSDGFIIEVSDSSRRITHVPQSSIMVGSNPFRTRPYNSTNRLVIPTDDKLLIKSPNYPAYYDHHNITNWIVSARRGRRIEAT
nr:CUB and sushi domain-containing protein 3-like [Lytechinus pictus]